MKNSKSAKWADDYWWFTGFVILLALMPLPFGSNRPWASNLFGVISSILLAGMAYHTYRVAPAIHENFPMKRVIVSALLACATIVWAFVQILPITPESWHHPLWKEVGDVVNVRGSISIDPGVFPESIVRIFGYISCFILAFYGGRDEKRASWMLKVLMFAGLAYAVYGILMQAFGIQYVLWFPKWAYQGYATSTFVNKNSYATYAGLGLLCSAGFLRQYFSEKIARIKKQSKHPFTVNWLQYFDLKDFFRSFIFIVILGALILTSSRAGFVSVVMGLIAYVSALALNQRHRGHFWIIGAMAGAILIVALVAIGGETLLARSEGRTLDSDMATRIAAYKLAVQAVGDNPIFGYGLGTFENAFRLYRDSSLNLWFQHAHNDYLEMAMELGVPATLCFITAILLMVSCCVQGVWKRKKFGEIPAVGFAASILVGVHATADFSLQIPAVTATYAALLGLGVAQSWSSRSGEQPVKAVVKKKKVAHSKSSS